MNKLELPILATISLCAGPILFLRSFHTFRLKRLIQNTPTMRIRSMAMGLVEINGAITAKSVSSAPFSGRPCAFWEVDVAVLLSMPSEVITVPRVAHLDTMNELLVIMTHKGERFVFPLDVLVGVKSQQGEKRSGARSAGFR